LPLSVISGDSLVGQHARYALVKNIEVLSVISGDSLVGQHGRRQRLERNFLTFSNLWRFSGGATPRILISLDFGATFSNLWRFSGGATFDLSLHPKLVYLSVISGDSLVGQHPLPLRLTSAARVFQ